MKTAAQLVAHVKMALAEKWVYTYGTFGQRLTPALLDYKLKQYPKNIEPHLAFIKANNMGRMSVDCVGLFKSFLWWSEKDKVAIYNPAEDFSANGSYERATVKGNLNTLPEIPGIALHRAGHVGVYIGNGRVIEAKGTRSGVVETPHTGTGSNNWLHWFQYPGISYEQAQPTLPQLSFHEILTLALDNPERWEKTISVLQGQNNIARMHGFNDMAVLEYTEVFVQKIFAAGFEEYKKQKERGPQ